MADAVEKILNDKEYSKMIGVNAKAYAQIDGPQG